MVDFFYFFPIEKYSKFSLNLAFGWKCVCKAPLKFQNYFYLGAQFQLNDRRNFSLADFYFQGEKTIET